MAAGGGRRRRLADAEGVGGRRRQTSGLDANLRSAVQMRLRDMLPAIVDQEVSRNLDAAFEAKRRGRPRA